MAKKRNELLVDTNFLMSYYNVTRLTILNWRKKGMPFKYTEYIGAFFVTHRCVRFSMNAVKPWVEQNTKYGEQYE